MAIQDFRLDAANVSFGKRTKTLVTAVADVADSLDGTYFTVSTPTVDYYVWFDGVAAADPAPASKTGIAIAYTTGATAITLAGLIKTAMEAVNFWVLDNGDGSFYIEPKKVGIAVGAVDVDCGFTFVSSAVGFGGDLGRTSDGISVEFSKSYFDLKANQSGEALLGQVKTGESVSVSMNLIEMSKQRWADVVGNGAGDKVTPAGGTEVVGGGTSKDYLNMFDYAGELELTPINTPDGSRNFVIWKALPDPSSYSFSGTDLSTMSVSFSGYIDESKDAKVSLYAFGDVSQDLRV
ncbi:MAG: hypothetical protein OEL89_00340 [Candidatus Peregrinibacteria bacterium]|nr:hypothetical protein [Candidatus Peregrinibacteria bacterium]